MKINESIKNASSPDQQYIDAVTNSALWSAAGDALGWITELARGPSSIQHRTGMKHIYKPVSWYRHIGGKTGPKVHLPAGTYSDDTQLRLAVSRSIRGNGSFDAEAFAKIELTVWPTYALGGGLGTKAAAVNLSHRGVNWFSNFYERGTQRYLSGGGNGAAMRIQPHVWSIKDSSEELLLDVLRDALVTHGHPHGFCGAIFHALALKETLENRSIPSPDRWCAYADKFTHLSKILELDPQLVAFWRVSWESSTNSTFESSLNQTREDALRDIEIGAKLIQSDTPYHTILDRLGCLSDRFRGSGFKTALAATILSYLHREGSIEDALVVSANELESDTDTIATMAGALLGAISFQAPDWDIQDRQYIESEAVRVAKIALKQPQTSFAYPELGRWNPPSNQTASVGTFENSLAIAGLGQLVGNGEEYSAGDAIWQWLQLPFGQTILAKRKKILKVKLSVTQLPSSKPTVPQTISMEPKKGVPLQTSLPIGEDETRYIPSKAEVDVRAASKRLSSFSIDRATDEIISANFDDKIFGHILNSCIDSTQSIESAIALISIVAKAKLARQRRHK